ncbi:DsbA family protein [bacterium]|nr:DsbA family protein [bacterium]
MDYSINKKWYKKWWAIIFFIFLFLISLVFILISIYIIKEVKNYQNPNLINSDLKNQVIYHLNTQKQYFNPEGNNSINFSIGTNTPKLTIVEFSSFSCPRSKSSFSKIRQLGLKYKDDVKVVFRHYPTDEHSFFLSQASYCAGEQGLFWAMHDKFFQNQGNFYEEDVYNFAKQISLDNNLFSKCMDLNKYEDEVKNDMIDAERLDIEGTPTWFFNGRKISGDIPLEMMEAIIQNLIE